MAEDDRSGKSCAGGVMVNTEIWVALIAFIGTVVGSLIGCVASSKLTNYRIQQLEKKVDKHNNVVERTFVLEGDIKEIKHDIQDLKSYHRP
jgi:ABC-type lipoprotein release transport system permease subunit